MKKSILIMIAASIVLLTGCGEKKSDASAYQVFYSNEEKNALVSAELQIKGENTLECIWDMWKKMQETTTGSGEVSLIPEELEIQTLDLTGGQLTVTFNTKYNKMSRIQEILFRAGLVEGVTQFPEVKTVVFHVGEDVLKDRIGEPIGAITRISFINNPVGINSYQYASLTLYFSNSTGNRIVKELRNVHYSTNTTLEKVVLDQLLAGPMNSRLNKVLTDDVKVLDIKVREKTCTLNLNQNFLNTAKGAAESSVVIYAIVNSLCDDLGVDRVQFQVEGNSDVVFGDSLSLAGPFHRNSEIIEMPDDSSQDSKTEGKELGEPQIGL